MSHETRQKESKLDEAVAEPDPDPEREPELQPYSCLSCRRKRKRCDRTNPCVNCRKSGIDCEFAPRKPSTRQYSGPSALERVKYLEALVQQLRAELELTQPSRNEENNNSLNRGQTRSASNAHPEDVGLGDKNEVADLQVEFGQLAIGAGRSRYIVSNFWANLTEQVDGLADTLEDLTEHEEPRMQDETQHHPVTASLLGLSPCYSSLRQLHPTPDKMMVYWRLYKENCDPVIKILHIPTIEPLILQYQNQLDDLPRGFEALLFAIYFSTIASLSDEECQKTLGAEKSSLISMYKAGMEQALAQAHLLETDEIIVLQAFAIFLSSLRNYCNLRLMWSFTSMAVRLAQNTGVHRDGTHFGLSPFTTETRRRLWWNICALDARAAEDSGYNTSIHAIGHDAQMPLNVNDTDLFPSMTEFPAPTAGFTSMTFSIVKFRATIVFQSLQNLSPGTIGPCGKLHTAESLEQRSTLILQYQDMLQKLFSGHDPSDPFYWYTAIISRIMLGKMWLMAYYPSLRLETCGGLPDHVKDSLFIRSITIVESQVLLYTGEPTAKWSWFCFSHVQWYAIAYILTELCSRKEGDLVEQAWRAINAVLNVCCFTPSETGAQTDDIEFGHRSKFGGLRDFEYKLLNRLLRKARAARLGQPGSSDTAVPHHATGAEDLFAAAHHFDDELISGAGILSSTTVGNCTFEPGDGVPVSAGYVQNRVLHSDESYSFDHLIYAPLHYHEGVNVAAGMDTTSGPLDEELVRQDAPG